MDRPGVASVVVPIHSADQLDEFAATPDLPPLDDGDLARIEALIESAFVPAPPPEVEDPQPGAESAPEEARVSAVA